MYITPDHVVGKVGLQHQEFGINLELKYVVSRLDVRDIDPLAVNVSIVCVITARAQALSVSCAGVAFQVTKITGGVLQTEASLVSLCHLTAGADLQQIIMAELIHAVVVLMTAMPLPGMTWPVRHEVSSPLVLHPLWESQQDPYIIVGGLRAIGGA